MILDFTNEKELAIPENFEQTAEKIAVYGRGQSYHRR